jgi:hypothetical protein
MPAEKGRFLTKDFGWGGMLFLPMDKGFGEKALCKG